MQWWSFTAPEFTVKIVETESSSVAAYCAIFHSTKHKSAQWVCGITELTARQAEMKCQQNWCRSAVKLWFCICLAWFTHLEPLDASVIFRKEVVSPIFLSLLCFAQRCLLSVPKYRALKVMRNERKKYQTFFRSFSSFSVDSGFTACLCLTCLSGLTFWYARSNLQKPFIPQKEGTLMQIQGQKQIFSVCSERLFGVLPKDKLKACASLAQNH